MEERTQKDDVNKFICSHRADHANQAILKKFKKFVVWK